MRRPFRTKYADRQVPHRADAVRIVKLALNGTSAPAGPGVAALRLETKQKYTRFKRCSLKHARSRDGVMPR